MKSSFLFQTINYTIGLILRACMQQNMSQLQSFHWSNFCCFRRKDNGHYSWLANWKCLGRFKLDFDNKSTYAGLLVVTVGAIVFTEHQIFPKIGYTRYWSKFQEYKNSSPAVLSWIIGLIFGFGLNALDVIKTIIWWTKKPQEAKLFTSTQSRIR